jgi:hypothetical protein
MDTDDLSEETYKAIMIEAEMFNHDLTLQFGVLSYQCKDDDDFIEKSTLLINEMKNYNENDLNDLFFGNPPKMNDFQKALKKILDNIADVKKIPSESRTFED